MFTTLSRGLSIVWSLSLAFTYAYPTTKGNVTPGILQRQSITTPLGTKITDLDLADISPIEDGFIELDSDDGDGNDTGSSSVSNANGWVGSVGSGQSSQNDKSTEGTSAACGMSIWRCIHASY